MHTIQFLLRFEVERMLDSSYNVDGLIVSSAESAAIFERLRSELETDDAADNILAEVYELEKKYTEKTTFVFPTDAVMNTYLKLFHSYDPE